MILDDKPFDQLTHEDISALIPDVTEGRRIDYKQAAPDGDEKSVRSFLNDVCSLANGAGGWLVYGVDEKREEDKQTGYPSSVCGVGDVNEDEAIRDWQQRITQNIEPRLIGHRVGFVHGFDDDMKVMVVYVPKSLFAPHRVNYLGKKEFYVRHDRCNLPMDMGEIRHAFVEAKEVPQRIDEYRRLRVMQILAGETPVELLKGSPIVVLHIMPLSSFAPDAAVDVTAIHQTTMPSMQHGMAGRRLNTDGCLFRTGAGDNYFREYEQVFRDGRVEACFTSSRMTISPNDVPSIRGMSLEKVFVESLEANLSMLIDLGVQPPIYIGLALLRVKNVAICPPSQLFLSDNNLIDKDIVLVPTVTAETMGEDASVLLRPAFDAMWQASGYPQSLTYNAEGRWSGR